MNQPEDSSKQKVYDACPHCGYKLSPWQQVLLSVDRALTCKNCWYKIILNPPTSQEKKSDDKTKFEE